MGRIGGSIRSNCIPTIRMTYTLEETPVNYEPAKHHPRVVEENHLPVPGRDPVQIA